LVRSRFINAAILRARGGSEGVEEALEMDGFITASR
jgi:hypothetical protein